MKPVKTETKFGVCPKCGADTKKNDNQWICENCGYKEKFEEE